MLPSAQHDTPVYGHHISCPYSPPPPLSVLRQQATLRPPSMPSRPRTRHLPARCPARTSRPRGGTSYQQQKTPAASRPLTMASSPRSPYRRQPEMLPSAQHETPEGCSLSDSPPVPTTFGAPECHPDQGRATCLPVAPPLFRVRAEGPPTNSKEHPPLPGRSPSPHHQGRPIAASLTCLTSFSTTREGRSALHAPPRPRRLRPHHLSF